MVDIWGIKLFQIYFLQGIEKQTSNFMQKELLITNFFNKYLQSDSDPIHVKPEASPVGEGQDTPSDATFKVIPKKKNTFPTLYNALSNTDINLTIKLQTGLYNQNNEFNTPDLKIQAGENSSNPIFISQEQPTIIINLPQKQDKVTIQGLKFAHTCKMTKHSLKWPSIKNVRQNRYHPLRIEDHINCSILVKKGILQIDQCRFSLVAQNDSRHLFPSIVIEEEGSLVISRSQFTGNAGTIGIYSIGGKLNIRECVFNDIGGVAVWINGGPQTSLVLKNSTLSKCMEAVVLNGPFCSSVQNNTITDCSGTGILTLGGNSSNLLNNQIRQCKNGIEVENSCPKVMKNNLLSNKQYGMCTWSRQNGECRPVLRFNILCDNKKGGLLIWGSKNKSEVRNNIVKLNQKVGIKVDSNAHPHIFLNQITSTFGNGIHICNGGTSFLQKNLIQGSLNCNLVLQGPRNIDNYVYNNKIESARGQGIFLLYCQKFLIAKNTVNNNYNGIVSITSVVNLQDNQLTNNKCNGVMLVNDCEILLNQNTFEGNRKAGLVCRNSSKAKMKNNRFDNNSIEALAEMAWDGVQDIQEENKFKEGADIRTPGGQLCQLI